MNSRSRIAAALALAAASGAGGWLITAPSAAQSVPSRLADHGAAASLTLPVATLTHGVSCVGVAFCMTVGVSDSADGTPSPLATMWTGGKLLNSPTAGGVTGYFRSVSCPSTSMCIGVGFVQVNAAATQTLAEIWNGHSWRVLNTPNPANHPLKSEFNAVSCASNANCLAVGYSTGSQGSEVPQIQGWNGASWKAVAAPQPATKDGYLVLRGVSCPTTGFCKVAGSLELPSGASQAFAADWNGSKWSDLTTFGPTGPKQTSDFESVSCYRADACTAVGDQPGTTSPPLIERWDGRSWHSEHVAVGSGISSVALFSVSCATSDRCAASGSSSDSRQHSFPYAAVWQGSGWKSQLLPGLPAPSTLSVLWGIGCGSANRCLAAGDYSVTSTGASPVLADEWDGSTWHNVRE